MKKIVKMLSLLFLLSGISNLAGSQNIQTLASESSLDDEFAKKRNNSNSDNERSVSEKTYENLEEEESVENLDEENTKKLEEKSVENFDEENTKKLEEKSFEKLDKEDIKKLNKEFEMLKHELGNKQSEQTEKQIKEFKQMEKYENLEEKLKQDEQKIEQLNTETIELENNLNDHAEKLYEKIHNTKIYNELNKINDEIQFDINCQLDHNSPELENRIRTLQSGFSGNYFTRDLGKRIKKLSKSKKDLNEARKKQNLNLNETMEYDYYKFRLLQNMLLDDNDNDVEEEESSKSYAALIEKLSQLKRDLIEARKEKIRIERENVSNDIKHTNAADRAQQKYMQEHEVDEDCIWIGGRLDQTEFNRKNNQLESLKLKRNKIVAQLNLLKLENNNTNKQEEKFKEKENIDKTITKMEQKLKNTLEYVHLRDEYDKFYNDVCVKSKNKIENKIKGLENMILIKWPDLKKWISNENLNVNEFIKGNKEFKEYMNEQLHDKVF